MFMAMLIKGMSASSCEVQHLSGSDPAGCWVLGGQRVGFVPAGLLARRADGGCIYSSRGEQSGRDVRTGSERTEVERSIMGKVRPVMTALMVR